MCKQYPLPHRASTANPWTNARALHEESVRGIRGSMDLVDEFFELFKQHGYEVFDDRAEGGGLNVESLERVLTGVQLTPQRSMNVRFIRTASGDQFLYVLKSTAPNGFWGPDKNVIDVLAKQTKSWALVLLHGSSTCGYWFPAATALSCTSKAEWRLGADGYGYRVNAPNQITRGEKFITPNKALAFVAQQGTEAA
jgi:hypothetical protein